MGSDPALKAGFFYCRVLMRLAFWREQQYLKFSLAVHIPERRRPTRHPGAWLNMRSACATSDGFVADKDGHF